MDESRCAGDGGKIPDPTWSLCPAAQGADGPGSCLPLLSLAALAPGSFAARLSEGWRRTGVRIGGGSGDLMTVGGPARPRRLLTVSGCEQAAACSPAGIALGMCFSNLHLFSPARTLARQRWGRDCPDCPLPPGPHCCSPTGREIPRERAAGLPATPLSPFASSVGSANTITSFQVAFSPGATLSSFAPWAWGGLSGNPWTGDAGGTLLRVTLGGTEGDQSRDLEGKGLELRCRRIWDLR